MSGYYRIVCHVNMHCSEITYLDFCIKYLAKKAKKANYPEIPPPPKRKNPPLENSKTENMLEMTQVRCENKNVKKIKALLLLGDITLRTKINLLETFVSNRYQ